MPHKKTNKRELAIEMREKGYNYREIAEELGVTNQRVAQYMSGNGGDRYYRIYDCIYPNLDRWIKKNKITIARLTLMLGYEPNAGTFRRVKYALVNKNIRKETIDGLLKLTGMTYEECFALAQEDK